jgi:hypothetical protein
MATTRAATPRVFLGRPRTLHDRSANLSATRQRAAPKGFTRSSMPHGEGWRTR